MRKTVPINVFVRSKVELLTFAIGRILIQASCKKISLHHIKKFNSFITQLNALKLLVPVPGTQ